MKKNTDVYIYGVVLFIISTVILMFGLDNNPSLLKIIIIVVFTTTVPLGLLIRCFYLAIDDKLRYKRLLIFLSTYNILQFTSVLTVILWILFIGLS